jgi:hypothetical protein
MLGVLRKVFFPAKAVMRAADSLSRSDSPLKKSIIMNSM